MDIVIMNPPFTKPSANNATDKAYSTFQSSSHDEDVQKAMQKKLNEKPKKMPKGMRNRKEDEKPRPYSAKAGFASAFVEMADNKLKLGGRAGFILPQTMMTAASWKKVRNLLANDYHNVMVITLANAKALEAAFSHDTNMAECMIVATKGKDKDASIPTGRARFVCLDARPDSLLSTETIAGKILKADGSRSIESPPYGGDELYIGECNFGRILDAPIDEKEWVVASVNSLSLLQTAYNLSMGKLYLTKLDKWIPIPITTIGNVGVEGYAHPTIKSPKIGAFDMHPRHSDTQDGYDALWHVKAETQRAMVTPPDYKAQTRVHKEKSADDIWERASRTHFHINPSYSANSILASSTEDAAIGVRSLTDVKLDNPEWDAAWTLWTNSTLGLLCHWLNAGKQQPGRGMYVDSQVPNVPTLDVRQLTEGQLKAADNIFAELKDARMLPYNECKHDPWRHILDARLLSEVFSITDEETHRAMQKLREMLCAEPTVAGTKLEENFCNLEEEREKFNLGGYAEADAKALEREQRTLETLGIYLPETEEPQEEARLQSAPTQ